MPETIRTSRFTVDRAAYLRTMYTYRLAPRLAYVAAILVAVYLLFAVIGQPVPIGVMLVWIVVALPLALLIRYSFARRNVYRPEARQVFDDPRTMEFSEVGIRTRTEGGVESTVPWTHVVKPVHRGGFTLLFMGPIVHLIVPDAAFASSEDRSAFEILVQTHVPTGKAKSR